jgi:hypoxanthine phosphoribosyltransferase
MRPPNSPDPGGIPAGGQRVLIIDDHADNRESLRYLLEL